MSGPAQTRTDAPRLASGFARFDACLAFTLAREGLFSDDPRDGGGATMEGVTLASYRAWRGDPGATAQELRAITPDDVRSFYRAGYWVPLACELLPFGADLLVFDMGANAGVRCSAMLLQQAVGVAADGWIGPATLAGVRKAPVLELVATLAQAQEHYYRGCEGFPAFGRGWLARLAQRKATAISACRSATGSGAGPNAQPPTASI